MDSLAHGAHDSKSRRSSSRHLFRIPLMLLISLFLVKKLERGYPTARLISFRHEQYGPERSSEDVHFHQRKACIQSARIL